MLYNPMGKFCYLRAPMGLAPSGDWFNSFTQQLLAGLEGVEKSMEDYLAKTPTLDIIELKQRFVLAVLL